MWCCVHPPWTDFIFFFIILFNFTGVRRRIKSKKDITEKETSEEASSEKAPEVPPARKSDQNPQQDPLKWFGILVPQSLKQAQSSFKQGMMLHVWMSLYFVLVLIESNQTSALLELICYYFMINPRVCHHFWFNMYILRLSGYQNFKHWYKTSI